MKIIPAIDLQAGKCVRLYQGDFSQVTEYSSDPAEIAQQFAALGAERLHIVDLDGARHGEQRNCDIVAAIASNAKLELQLGGGIRSEETVALWLAAGVSSCVVGSLALIEPDTVKAWLARFGGDRIILALDVRQDQQKQAYVTTHGWTRDSKTTLFECINDFRSAGLQHVLCTDVIRDGAMTGPNFDLYEKFVAAYPELHLQASGGVRSIADLERLRSIGVAAAISGRALLDGRITAEEIAQFLRNV